MAKRKPTPVRHQMIDAASENLVPTAASAVPTGVKLFGRTKLLYGIAALLALSALLLANKGLIVAAVVNGRPIFRWQLDKTLMSRFGKQTLEGMISEELIADAAKKSNVTVTAAEIQAKQTDILKGLGENVKLEDLLKYQGITKEDFDSQIKLQLTVQKILGRDLAIGESDIDSYIATNRATLIATDPGELRAEAKKAIIDQKVGELLQPWFMELKNKAKILRFIN